MNVRVLWRDICTHSINGTGSNPSIPIRIKTSPGWRCCLSNSRNTVLYKTEENAADNTCTAVTIANRAPN